MRLADAAGGPCDSACLVAWYDRHLPSWREFELDALERTDHGPLGGLPLLVRREETARTPLTLAESLTLAELRLSAADAAALDAARKGGQPYAALLSARVAYPGRSANELTKLEANNLSTRSLS